MQTEYNLEQGVASAGMLADINESTIRTYNNPSEEIPFGRAVAKVSADDDGCQLPENSSADVLGVAIQDTAQEDESYPTEEAIGVLKKGAVYVQVEEAVTPDSDVYVRYSGKAQIQVLTFDADLITGNQIDLDINGVSMTSVNFDTTHATTMSNLAWQIQNEFAEVATAVSDDVARTVTITASQAGEDGEFSIENAAVTGGASQAGTTVTESQASVDAEDRGLFRQDDDDSTALQLTNARYLTSASSGELVMVDLSLT